MDKRTEEFLRGNAYFIHENLLGVLRGNVDTMLSLRTQRNRAIEYRNIRQVLQGLRLIPRDSGKILGLAFGVRPYGDRGLFVFCEAEQIQASLPEDEAKLADPEPKRELLFRFSDFKEGERFVDGGKVYTKLNATKAKAEDGEINGFGPDRVVQPAKPEDES